MLKYFLKLTFCVLIFSFISCEAQKPMMKLESASRGNTGFRGRVPDEEMNKPLTGNVFVEINLSTTKDCRIDSIFVTLKDPDVCLRDVSQTYPKSIKVNEVVTLRIENKDGTPAHWENKLEDNSEGFLDYYVEGKKQQIIIKSFKMILPK